MKPGKWVWVNGSFKRFGHAKIPIFCGAVQYGMGLFAGIRFFESKNGKRGIFRLRDHIERVNLSAEVLGMTLPISSEQLQESIIKTVKKNGLREGYIRPYFGLTEKKLGLEPNPFKVTASIAVFEWPSYFTKPLSLRTSSIIRPHPKSLDMRAKISGYYANSRLAKLEAQKGGFDDALMLDHEGFPSEASVANIFICWKNTRGSKIITTPESESILLGITRNTIITLLCDKKYTVTWGNIDPGLLYGDRFGQVNEMFVCGTAVGVVPVVSIDRRPIGNGKPGPITKMLQKVYAKTVRGEIPRYEHWLTYIE